MCLVSNFIFIATATLLATSRHTCGVRFLSSSHVELEPQEAGACCPGPQRLPQPLLEGALLLMPGGGPRDLLGAPHNSFAGPPLSPHVVFAPLSFPRGLHIHIVVLNHYVINTYAIHYEAGGFSGEESLSCLTKLPTLDLPLMTGYSTGNA